MIRRAHMTRPPLPAEQRVPAQSRLAPSHPLYAEILAVHERALEAGVARYPDPATGFWVFTAGYLWDRGTCCDTGCRHCPYVEPR
jgi:hypothetical protein